jgi:4-amino-4-deoxy-L-arabinose transferase-like glycosyltransferase
MTKYKFFFILILLVATALRFYNFSTHWGLGNDDARDALIGKEALLRNELPVMGSFSSAGPFAFGPLFYWTIILSYLLFPFTYLAPWIFTGIFGILTIIILIYCGKYIGGTRLALLTGILAATSPQLVIRSLSLGQHTYVAFWTSVLLLNYILLWQNKKAIYAFFMGISLGIAYSMHFQVLNLFLFFPILLFVPYSSFKQKIAYLFLMIVGFLLPSFPTIIWESNQQFANTRNLLDYLLVGQYRIYVPNSWRLFLFTYFPNYWSFVLGGYNPIALILIITTAWLFLSKLIRRTLSSTITPLAFIFLILFIVNRYYRGERSEGYLLYLLPFIILFTSYTIYSLNRLFATALLLLILGGNLFYYRQHYLNYHSPVASFRNSIHQIISKYPNQKFSVYDYNWQNSYLSQPLSFLLQVENKIDKHGLPIGFNKEQPYEQITLMGGQPLYNLSSAADLSPQSGWVNVNQANMYDDLMKWSKTEKLQSNFTFLRSR